MVVVHEISERRCARSHLWPCWLGHRQVFEEDVLGRHAQVSNWLI